MKKLKKIEVKNSKGKWVELAVLIDADNRIEWNNNSIYTYQCPSCKCIFGGTLGNITGICPECGGVDAVVVDQNPRIGVRLILTLPGDRVRVS